MILPQLRSSYLVKPNLSSRKHRNWRGFRTQIVTIKRTNPRLLSRVCGALFIWCLVFEAVSYTTSPHGLGNHNQFSLNPSNPITSALSPTSTALAAAVAAETLPDGPSGQLLPPGTMAPDRTYSNNYAGGQCTWYVASRRQIPGNWGNAASWYYHAKVSGWSIGTTPAIAAIAWTPTGYFGHVALVEQISDDRTQVYLSEMNYQGRYVKSHRWAPASSFKYIY